MVDRLVVHVDPERGITICHNYAVARSLFMQMQWLWLQRLVPAAYAPRSLEHHYIRL